VRRHRRRGNWKKWKGEVGATFKERKGEGKGKERRGREEGIRDGDEREGKRLSYQWKKIRSRAPVVAATQHYSHYTRH